MADLPSGDDSVATESTDNVDVDQESMAQWLLSELTGNPINIVLLFAIGLLLYKILKPESESSIPVVGEPPLPPMKRRDFTLQDLKEFDGTGPDGRVLMGVLGKVYDVTKGKRFYGPGGPYSAFAGRDASRGLATFEVQRVSDDHDDLSDLKPSELDQVREWDEQFNERYQIVGKLLKPGEEPTAYSDDEEETTEETKKDL